MNSKFSLFSIKQTLIISHLILVLVLISSLSFVRYQSEWGIHVQLSVERAEEFLLSQITELSTLVAGRNYSNLMLPSQLDEYQSHKKLLYLDIKGTSDYQHQPVHVRYDSTRKNIWREDIMFQEIESLREQRSMVMALVAKADKSDTTRLAKLKYVLQKATDDYVGGLKSMQAKQQYVQKWDEPSVGNTPHTFDNQQLQVHVIYPLRNELGGRVWAVFDVSKLKSVRQQILTDIVKEAVLAILASLLLIAIATRQLILPITRLSQHMKTEVEHIDIETIDERFRKDELGELANSFILLVTKIRSQLRVLKDRSYLDTLTGLGSRYKYSRHAESFLLNAIQSKQSFSVIICDIDNFKAYNDTYGHLQGDSVIKSVAKAIVDSTGTYDECYRIGGEEFVILTRDAYPEKAEDIRRAVEGLGIAHSLNSGKDIVTVSAGLSYIEPADYYEDEQNISRLYYEMFDKADQQLYLAKNQGRNKVMSVRFGFNSSQA